VARARESITPRLEILTRKIAPNLYRSPPVSRRDPGNEDAAGGADRVLAGPDGFFMRCPVYAQITEHGRVAAIRKSARNIRFWSTHTCIPISHRGQCELQLHGRAAVCARRHLSDGAVTSHGNAGRSWECLQRASHPAGASAVVTPMRWAMVEARPANSRNR